MPESITDRPTKAHEYVFLLSKSARYFYDMDAVKEKAIHEGRLVKASGSEAKNAKSDSVNDRRIHGGFTQHDTLVTTRNKRTVWEIATQPFSGWQETVRLVPAGPGERGGDTKRIGSRDCPVHGDRLGPRTKVLRDEHEAGGRPRTGHIASRLAPSQFDARAPIDQHPGRLSASENSDLPGRQDSSVATRHSSQTRKTAPSPGTNPPCTLFAQTAECIGGMSGKPGFASPTRNGNPESNTAVAGSPSPNATEEIVDDTRGKTALETSCICEYYRETTEKSSHFATMPAALVEPCIKAGTSEHGVCPACGAPWVRQVERTAMEVRPSARRADLAGGKPDGGRTVVSGTMLNPPSSVTVGWAATCECAYVPDPPVPATVLDPFCGAGTVGLVADRLGRSFVGVELNPEYAELARRRIEGDAPLFASVDLG